MYICVHLCSYNILKIGIHRSHVLRFMCITSYCSFPVPFTHFLFLLLISCSFYSFPVPVAHFLSSVPVNPTSNLVSLSRFFRNARPPLGGRRVYMDMVRTLQRSNHSHTSLCGTSGRRSRGVADQPSCESVSSSKSFSKQEMFYPDDSVDKVCVCVCVCVCVVCVCV